MTGKVEKIIQELPTAVHGIDILTDQEAKTVQLKIGEGASGGTRHLNADELTEVISSLGSVRAHLVSGNPPPKLEGEQLDAVLDPRWFTTKVSNPASSLLAFAHPAYGPIAFLIPLDQVPDLIRALSNQVLEAATDRRQQ